VSDDRAAETGLLKPDADAPDLATQTMYWPFFTDEFQRAHDGRVFAPLAEVVTTALLRLTYNIAHGLLPPGGADSSPGPRCATFHVLPFPARFVH
jgi:hypothetical protein